MPLFSSISDFLLKAGPDLVKKVSGACAPRATDETPAHPALADLLRSPLEAQKLVIMGLFSLLKEVGFSFVCADMGWGKTYMALALTYLMWLEKFNKRNGANHLVIVPSTLTTTWIEEIALTLPKSNTRLFLVGKIRDGKEDCGCYQVEWDEKNKEMKFIGNSFSIRDLADPVKRARITESENPAEPVQCFWIASKETLKLGAFWRQAPAVRRLFSEGYQKERTDLRIARELEISLPSGQSLFWSKYPLKSFQYVLAEEIQGSTVFFGSNRWGEKNTTFGPLAEHGGDAKSALRGLGYSVLPKYEALAQISEASEQSAVNSGSGSEDVRQKNNSQPEREANGVLKLMTEESGTSEAKPTPQHQGTEKKAEKTTVKGFPTRFATPKPGGRIEYLRNKFSGLTTLIPVCPDTGVEVEKLYSTVKTRQEGKRKHCGATTVLSGETYYPKPAQASLLDRKFEVPIWQYDENGIRRWAPGEVILSHLKGVFDVLIVDEGHKYNNHQSAQGNLVARLFGATKAQIVNTGTLTNGNSLALWAPLWRIAPERMKSLGYGLDKGPAGPKRFAEQFGLVETVITQIPSDNRSTKARQQITHRMKPGIMPQVHATDFTGKGLLMELSVFTTLQMISKDLPKLTESVKVMPPVPELGSSYAKIANDFRKLWRSNRRLAMKAMSQVLTVLTNYLDRPYGWEPIIVDEVVITTPRNLDPEMIYPKEQEFIDLVKAEKAQGRKVLTYIHYQKYRVVDRLMKLLEAEGIKGDYLTSSVPPPDRKKWFFDAVGRGVEVTFCNPECVAEGLTLLDWPTLIFYQSGRNIITNTQAEKRSYRIGQKRDVRLFYMGYSKTIQEITLKVMASKKAALQAIQGIFGEGFVEFSDDITYAIARELVKTGAVAEAGEFWSKMVVGTAPEGDDFFGSILDWMLDTLQSQGIEISIPEEPLFLDDSEIQVPLLLPPQTLQPNLFG